MNAQEVFDKVATHLMTQGQRAMLDEATCAYRSPSGLKCAVGCLITDEAYAPEMEGLGLTTLIERFRHVLPLDIVANWRLLSRLQGVHDDKASWVDIKEILRFVATEFCLSATVIDNFIKP